MGSSRSQLLSQAVRALKPAAAAVSSGFFSSLFSSFSNPATPQASTPQPPPIPENKDPFELRKSTVVLQIFSVEADVRLDKKMVTELQRSTKKNPPNHLRLDLIYVCPFFSPILKVYSQRPSEIRLEKKNTMLANVKMNLMSIQQVVFSKAFGLI